MHKLLWLVVLLSLVACSHTTPATSHTPQPFSTDTSSPSAGTTLITSSPPQSVTATPIPSSTLTPHPTSTLTPLLSPTPDLAATLVAIQQPLLYASYPSPDNQWRMDILIYDCINIQEGSDEFALEQLLLVDQATGEQQLADQQLQSCGGLGAYGFGGRFWSPNNRYFYYTTARQGVPDGCGYWDAPLSRMDIVGMESEYLGIGTLSPDGSKLSTFDAASQRLAVWDVEGEEISRVIPLRDDAQLGPIVWSPDSQSLIYIQVESWCPVSGKSYLVLVDLAELKQTLLLESESPTFGGAEWDSADQLSLFDENGGAWRFNLLTGDLTRVP